MAIPVDAIAFPLDVVYVGPAKTLNNRPLVPTNTRPGTRARIEVYARRAKQGLPLFVLGDYTDPESACRGRISFDTAPCADDWKSAVD